ncbi:hypothetical protein NUACC21_74620 [Scytonema sp. NUACC21]
MSKNTKVNLVTLFRNLGTFTSDAVEGFVDAYKFSRGQWAKEEREHEQLLLKRESELVTNGFISNDARVAGLRAKLYQDAMSGKPTEDTLTALAIFEQLHKEELAQARLAERRRQRNLGVIGEGVIQIILFGTLAYLATSFTQVACYQQQRDSAYCQQVKAVQKYFLGN